MNLQDLIATTEKDVSTQNVLKDKASVTLLFIKKGGVLKEHQSMTNALLVLLSGKAVYEEKDRTEHLAAVSDFVRIPAHVTHKLTGLEDARLLLIQ